MNNKKLGTAFEKQVLQILKERMPRAWIHFLSPDERGAQPFDIIVVQDGMASAVECKTLDAKRRYFPIDRLEDNQIMAFERWMLCGNPEPLIAIKHGDKIKTIGYSMLKEKGKVDLNAL